MANPLARVAGPVTQINANCDGPIVNLIAFAGPNCSSNGTSIAADYSSISLTKFSAVPATSGVAYQSECKEIIDSDDPALSVIYISDGANQRRCNLDFFTDSNCKSDLVRKNLKRDVSECENVEAAYARVTCTK